MATSDPPAAVPRSVFGGRRMRVSKQALLNPLPALAMLAVIIGGWQALVSFGDIQPMLLPSPASVLEELGEVTESGLLSEALRDTMSALAVGLLAGILAGGVVGIILGAWPKADVVASPYVWGLFSTPDIALVPIMILWFGFGSPTKIWMVFLAVSIPMALAARDGVRTIDPTLLKAAVSYCASRPALFVKVVAPGMLPSLATGMRNGISKGFSGVLVVEMTVGSSGLGREVMYAMRQFNTARMFAFIAVLIVLAMTLITLSKALERGASRWRDEVAL